MTKNNELVAFKASGLSLYRIALPLLLGGVFLAASLLVLDDTYLPYANQRQDALRNQIKGRPAQTYYQPNRQWIFGENAKIYNYELFDPDRELFGGLNVFELDPATFEMRRRIYAARAHWDVQQGLWILESGWIRDFDHGQLTGYTPFLANALNELSEPPSYFNREVRQSYQMTWWELQRYIGDLRQAGFDVARLSVQLQKKLSFPAGRPAHYSVGDSFLHSGRYPRRGGRRGLGCGDCNRLLGRFRADRSDGGRRAIAAALGRVGAGYGVRISGTVLLLEDADVTWDML